MILRPVEESDLPHFFEHQADPVAVTMAAFTAKDPSDRAAFEAHWRMVLGNPTGVVRTIVDEGRVAGHVFSYEEAGRPEVSYWIDRRLWGRGLATAALRAFLADVEHRRPIAARVAADNPGSIRVLEKCGFRRIGADRGYANARGEEIEEWIFELKDAPVGNAAP